MSHCDFTEKQKAAVKAIAKTLKGSERRHAMAFIAMVFQKKLGENRAKRVAKNPDLGGTSSLINLERRKGRFVLADRAKRMKRPGLAKRIFHYDERCSGKRRRIMAA